MHGSRIFGAFDRRTLLRTGTAALGLMAVPGNSPANILTSCELCDVKPANQAGGGAKKKPRKKGDPCDEIRKEASILRKVVADAKRAMRAAMDQQMRLIRAADRALKSGKNPQTNKPLTNTERVNMTRFGKQLMKNYEEMSVQATGRSAPWTLEIHKTVFEPFDQQVEKWIRKALKLAGSCKRLKGGARNAQLREARKFMQTARMIAQDHVKAFNKYLKRTNSYINKAQRYAGPKSITHDKRGNLVPPIDVLREKAKELDARNSDLNDVKRDIDKYIS